MSDIIKLEDIVKEAEYIINNNIEDESKIRKMLGQLLIDKMQSEIDNWDGLKIPRIYYECTLYTFFEDLFKIFIPKKLNDIYYSDKLEFRYSDWGDSLVFSAFNPIKTLNVLDKNNNMYKRELIDGKATLETNNLCINFWYWHSFCDNKVSIKKIIDLVIKDIKECIDEKIKVLQDNTQVVNLPNEKLIKIGIADSGLLMEVNGYLSFCIKIGVGMLG